MMRPLLACVLCAALATPLPAAKSEPSSWGKPGVSIEQYRSDAVECGRAGYYLDVADTEAAKMFKAATTQLENNEADLSSSANDPRTPAGLNRIMNIVSRSGRIVESIRPTERYKEVGTLMQDTISTCLKQRGYVAFRLTNEQRDRLQHLHLGSPERHAYLFALASDPQILKAQAI